MQTNNNPVVEIGVILIALGFIAAGTTLLALGKVDLSVAMTLYILAASVAGINVALKAPSPTQQQLLAQALQTQQAQPAQLVQAPAPVATPQVVQMPFPNSTTAVQPQVVQQFSPLTGFPIAGTNTMPQAIMTTQTSMPTVNPQ